MIIRQYKEIIIASLIGLLLGITVTFMYDQYQNVTAYDYNDTLKYPETIKGYTFFNYDIYVDKNTTKIIGEIKNNSSQKQTLTFTVDIVDDVGETLGTSKEVRMVIGARKSKPFLAVINTPIEDYADASFNVISE